MQPDQAHSFRPPVVLTIAGSDSGGGAGLQADLKTFAALQVHGCSALTCVTAQNTLGVERVDALPPEAVTAQIAAVCGDLTVNALKTGMLLNRRLIEATAAAIAELPAIKVIDPVMVSRAGAVLLEDEAIDALRHELLPQADLLTPNLHEARLLSGMAIDAGSDDLTEVDDLREAEWPARLEATLEEAASRIAALGPRAILIKGGGLRRLRGCDLLWRPDGKTWLRSVAIDTPHTHGSGCTLAAAITAHSAHGLDLAEAVVAAKRFVEGGLRHSLTIGSGQGPLCHWHASLPPLRAEGSARTRTQPWE